MAGGNNKNTKQKQAKVAKKVSKLVLSEFFDDVFFLCVYKILYHF